MKKLQRISSRALVVFLTLLMGSSGKVDNKKPPPLHPSGSPPLPHLQTNQSIVQSIVGGKDVKSFRFPWFVQGGGCGGALIAADIVLTAAHCTSHFAVGSTVHIGNIINGEGGTTATVKSQKMHSHYDKPPLHYDIMIVQLNEPVTSAKTIAINFDPKYPTDGIRLMAVGFGITGWEGEPPDQLQKVTLVEFKDCGDYYNRNIDKRVIICAGSNLRRGTCVGDSGGPLVDTARGLLVGVTNFGKKGCGEPNFPSGFARTSHFLRWMQKNVCSLSASPPALCQLPAARLRH